ncbi:hypothetical protein PGTUg99_023407 [Puccinia graminis f. sp. tritici]|uniref:CxC1-like cysteine cluster associated with KDZ transposases domain-containing protein n=2 Tax=Puccinia graminis f. sp. tritici TaxID=56615 RepID=A0A5B0SJY7_PUCGR|nr:hypothetical protein PGTUg99_023407 [Puccinia graminis f. sp. tritici]
MGYIGGAPKFPRTAFSIRLLQFHHIVWKHSAIALTPFSKALDEHLDFNSPLILVNRPELEEEGTYTTRQWRKTLSSAIDAYREMLHREELLLEELLQMSKIKKLAELCPKCFGPTVPGKKEDEPDYIVCMDGNFQYRRHKAASNEIIPLKTPSLFINPDEVEAMAISMSNTRIADVEPESSSDRCTDQHTATNDVCGGHTWKACDDTGIFGMACRHDQILSLINIVRSGERAYFPMTMIDYLLKSTLTHGGTPKKCEFLYNIGCNIEKGISRRDQFSEEQSNNQLKFGSSVFHAYVHKWSCQLKYNPRINEGWGMSDGEGMERIWAYLSPLISSLRYSTKNHRLSALHFRSTHHNQVGKMHAFKLLLDRGKTIEKMMRNSQKELQEISDQHGHHTEYLKNQWFRQIACQLSQMETESQSNLKKQVDQLIDLEDKLREAHEEMVEIQRRQRRTQTVDQVRHMDELPSTLIWLEQQIERIVEELGSEFFESVSGASKNPTDFESELCAKHSCSRLVLDSIYDNLAKKNCRVWMAWNSHCHELLQWSKKYLNMEDPDDRNMEQSWDLVITHCKSMWEKLINQDSIIMELEDHEEYEEEEMLQEEELQTQVENDEDILAGEDEED